MSLLAESASSVQSKDGFTPMYNPFFLEGYQNTAADTPPYQSMGSNSPVYLAQANELSR